MVKYQLKVGNTVTVWKFRDFCISEILREINFVDSSSAKTAVFANLGAVVTFSLKSAKIHKNPNSVIEK